MTNLEFIEKEIDAYKQIKEHAILNISDADDDDELFELQERINFANERLPILQSIKNELEAWEICKNKKVDIHDIIYCSNSEVYNCGLYKEYQLTQQEHEIIKKALEVKEC